MAAVSDLYKTLLPNVPGELSRNPLHSSKSSPKRESEEAAPEFGSWRVGDVTRASIRVWLSRLQSGGLSPSRTRQVRSVLSQVMEHALDAGSLRANPVRGVKVSGSSDREMLFLDAGQVARVADEAERIDQGSGTLVYLLAYSGTDLLRCQACQKGSGFTI